VPANIIEELRRDMARLALLREQINACDRPEMRSVLMGRARCEWYKSIDVRR
jgi:hypothetical protein